MRKLKFRAWDFVERCFLNSIDMSYGVMYHKYNLLINGQKDVFEFNQYTDQNDINDKEIFEGDIVFDGKDYLEILWDEDRCCFQMRCRYSKSHIIRQLDCDVIFDRNIKVVGNIYQNIQLLDD